MQMFRKLIAGNESITGETCQTTPAKRQTQEEVLLQQLNDNFRKLDEMNERLETFSRNTTLWRNASLRATESWRPRRSKRQTPRQQPRTRSKSSKRPSRPSVPKALP